MSTILIKRVTLGEADDATAAEASSALAPAIANGAQGALTGADKAKIDGLQSSINTSVAVETARAQAAEATNATAITTEAARATAAEGTNANNITYLQSLAGTISANVSNETSRATTAEGTKVAKAGDTMTGALVLPGNPASALQAAPKQYVDAETTRATAAEGTNTTNIATNTAAIATNTAAIGTNTTAIATNTVVGEIKMFAGVAAPSGWAFCDGSSVLRTGAYANLFAAIGTVFGAVDGTHFTLPDMRGRVPVGVGTGSGLTARALGAGSGEESHVLSSYEMPPHNHTLSDTTQAVTAGGGYGAPIVLGNNVGGYGGTVGNTGTSGGGLGHNNMQPFLALNFIIKL